MTGSHPAAPVAIARPRGLPAAERALAIIDLVIGIALLLMASIGIVSSLLPSRRDNSIFGLVGGVVVFVAGLLGLAAWDAMRTRATGRWMLQSLVLALVAAVGSRFVV